MKAKAPSIRQDFLKRAIAILATISFVGCDLVEPPQVSLSEKLSDIHVEKKPAEETNARLNQLYTALVPQILTDHLWSPINAYDAGHHLMLPVEYAYSVANPEWIELFREHGLRFLASDPEEFAKITLYRMHYIYFLARLLALDASFDAKNATLDPLYNYIYQRVYDWWLIESAWQWPGQEPRAGFEGIKRRVEWKQNIESPSKIYYGAYLEHDLFLFSIAAELAAYLRCKARPEPPVISEILDVAHEVYLQSTQSSLENPWLFQRGVWTDHTAYLYAGHLEFKPELEIFPYPEVPWDSSHSHRFPVWLNSLKGAEKPGSERWNFYQNSISNLERQFVEKVLVYPSERFPGFRTVNYLDGHNGLYDYRYSEAEKLWKATSPFGFSGTLFLGWWGYLHTDAVREVYTQMANAFPYSDAVIAEYVGSNTSRERHPLMRLPDKFSNGVLELLTRIAANLEPVKSCLPNTPID